MTKAIIYLRVSTTKQAIEGESLAVQEKRLRSYCEAHGLEVHEVIRDEGVSAKTPLAKRPGGSRALKQLGPDIPHIVVLKFDRMFRNTLDALATIAQFNEHGISLHALDFGGQAIDTSTAFGQMVITLRAGFAQMERDICRERTIEAIRHKKGKGERTGQIPFGYTAQESKLVKHPEYETVMQQMKDLREEGKSLRTIADIISADHDACFKATHESVRRILNREQ